MNTCQCALSGGQLLSFTFQVSTSRSSLLLLRLFATIPLPSTLLILSKAPFSFSAFSRALDSLSLKVEIRIFIGRMRNMKTLAFHVPDEIDLALGCPKNDDLGCLLRLLLAVKLFESGRTTSGQSAIIAGLSRRAFLLELPKHGVPSVLWDKEELEAEATPLAS